MSQEPDLVRDLLRAAQPSAEESQIVRDLRDKIARMEQVNEDTAQDADMRMRALRQEVCLSVSVFLSVCLSVCLSICLSVIFLSICLSLFCRGVLK